MAVVGYSGDYEDRGWHGPIKGYSIPRESYSERLRLIEDVEKLLIYSQSEHELFGELLPLLDVDLLRKCNKKFAITHPLDVALLFSEYFPDYKPYEIVACVAHDLAEDKKLNYSALIYTLGGKKDIADVVWNLTKRQNQTPEEYRDQLAEEGSFTSICIKAVDTFHNLKHIDGLPEDRQQAKASEYLENAKLFQSFANFWGNKNPRSSGLLRLTEAIREICREVLPN